MRSWHLPSLYLRSLGLILKPIPRRTISSSSLHHIVLDNTSTVTVDGIKLRLLDNMQGELDEDRIENDRRLQRLLKDPFWGYLWPGSFALHKLILSDPSVIQNRNVLDFASGCGLSAITASKFSPLEVIANDIDDFSIAAIEVNCELNSIEQERITVTSENLCASSTKVSSLFCDPEAPLTILCGDVFYDAEFAEIVMNWLSLQDALIYAGDPGRHALPQSGELEEVASYDLPPLLRDTNNGLTSVSSFRFNK